MKLAATIIGLFWMISLVSVAWAQTDNASAQSLTRSSGRPSTLELQQNTLKQQQAIITSELREVRACIQSSLNLTSLRDPQGNINSVPKTDLVNCSRRLNALLRRLEALAREADALASDAQAQAQYLERTMREAQRRERISGTDGR